MQHEMQHEFTPKNGITAPWNSHEAVALRAKLHTIFICVTILNLFAILAKMYLFVESDNTNDY